MFAINLFGTTYNVSVQTDKYREGKALAVSLIDETGAAFATVSVNMPPHSAVLPQGVFYGKDWSENETIIPQLIANGIIRRRDDIPAIPSGFVTVKAFELISVP